MQGRILLLFLPLAFRIFGRTGLNVNKLRYHCDGYTEPYLSGGVVTVAYNPENVTSVWVLEDGAYTEFALIESPAFREKTLLRTGTTGQSEGYYKRYSKKQSTGTNQSGTTR